MFFFPIEKSITKADLGEKNNIMKITKIDYHIFFFYRKCIGNVYQNNDLKLNDRVVEIREIDQNDFFPYRKL